MIPFRVQNKIKDYNFGHVVNGICQLNQQSNYLAKIVVLLGPSLMRSNPSFLWVQVETTINEYNNKLYATHFQMGGVYREQT